MFLTLYYLALALITASIIKALWAIHGVRNSLRIMQKPAPRKIDIEGTSACIPAPSRALPRLIFVICALREQQHLEEAVAYLSALPYPGETPDILIVTSERELQEEDCADGGISTPAIARQLEEHQASVRHLHYPRSDGLKSDQMNYAVESVPYLYPGYDPEKTYFVFYDADSRPFAEVLRVFAHAWQKEPDCHVFQQSAIYLKNYQSFTKLNSVSRSIMRAQALKQTRFIFAYEIQRILRVYHHCTGLSRSWLARITYAPCVAHGLIVRVSFLQKFKFPSNYTPEDMFWGFLVTSCKEKISLLPCLDVSETPDSVEKIFFQLARWFQGPFLSFRYLSYLSTTYPDLYNKHRHRALALCGFALYDAIVWLATSTLLYFFLFMAIWGGGVLPAFLVLYVLLYQYPCLLIAQRFVGGSLANHFPVLGAGLLIMLFHSLPAYYSLMRVLCGKTVDVKTERTAGSNAKAVKFVPKTALHPS